MIFCTSVLVNTTQMTKQAPILRCTFFHQYLEFVENNYPNTPITFSKMQWDNFKNPILMEKHTLPFYQFHFCFGSTPPGYLSLCRAIIFGFILLYTRVRHIRNDYITIYTIRKYHFTCTYV